MKVLKNYEVEISDSLKRQQMRCDETKVRVYKKR